MPKLIFVKKNVGPPYGLNKIKNCIICFYIKKLIKLKYYRFIILKQLQHNMDYMQLKTVLALINCYLK